MQDITVQNYALVSLNSHELYFAFLDGGGGVSQIETLTLISHLLLMKATSPLTDHAAHVLLQVSFNHKTFHKCNNTVTFYDEPLM